MKYIFNLRNINKGKEPQQSSEVMEIRKQKDEPKTKEAQKEETIKSSSTTNCLKLDLLALEVLAKNVNKPECRSSKT